MRASAPLAYTRDSETPSARVVRTGGVFKGDFPTRRTSRTQQTVVAFGVLEAALFVGYP